MYKSWTRIFLGPDTGSSGSAGGSTGNPGAQQGGATASSGSSSSEAADPYAGLDLNDLDPETRKVVEAAQKQFASLQKEKADAEKLRLEAEGKARQFQSAHDQLQHQVKKLTGGGDGSTQNTDPKAAQLEKIKATLIKRGVPEAQAGSQAELLNELFDDYGTALKAEVGKAVQPFATNVLQRDAQHSWMQAVQNDTVGMFQNEEVSKLAWLQVQELTAQGQQVTPEVIENLAAMAYVKHLKANPNANPQIDPSIPPHMQLPQAGRLPSGGGGFNPSRPAFNDPNAARTTLDSATDIALQSVFKTWAKDGVKAPGYREPAKKGAK